MEYILTEKVKEIARQKGREKGIKEVKREVKEEVAKKMIKNNEPINKIIKYTNIPKEKIIQLKQDN